MNECIPKEFEPLFERAKQAALSIEDSGMQVLLLLSSQQRILCHVLDYNSSAEKAEYAVIDALRTSQDTEITKLICIWQGGHLDLPSFRLRTLLCELNCKNSNTEMLLQGRDDFAVKTIAASLP